MALKRFNAFSRLKGQRRSLPIGLKEKAKVAAYVYNKMLREGDNKTEIAKANAVTKADPISAKAIVKRILRLRRSVPDSRCAKNNVVDTNY